MKQKKKRLGTFIMLIVLVPFFAFATGQSETTTSDELMEITWQFRYETSWALEDLNEMFNVNIISNGLWNNDSEAMDLMFASGDIPDVFTRGDVAEHYQEGITRSIPNSMIRQYAPNYTSILNKYPWAWIYHATPDKEDEQIGVVGVSLTSTWPFFFPAFRVDWAKNLGIELPNYEENKRSLEDAGRVYFLDEGRDIQWFEDLMVAFRDGDADGDGKNDTIPLAGCTNFSRSFAGLIGAFGVLLLAFFPELPIVLVAAIPIAISVAALFTVLWALANDLVTPGSAARDLGFTGIAFLVGGVVARFAGFAVDALNSQSENLGYRVLLFVIAAAFVLMPIALQRFSRR